MSDIGYTKFDLTSTTSPVILTRTSSICEGSAFTTSLYVVSFLCSITFFTYSAALGGVIVRTSQMIGKRKEIILD